MERIPASDRTREKLKALMEGRNEVAAGRSELVRLAARLIIEEALEGEAQHRGGTPPINWFNLLISFVDSPLRRGYLFRARWANGFVCPACGGVRGWGLSGKRLTARRVRSLAADSIPAASPAKPRAPPDPACRRDWRRFRRSARENAGHLPREASLSADHNRPFVA
jgi:hypothetical protein